MFRNTAQLYWYAGITLFLALAVKTGECIMCWECNSEYDRRCADDFNKGPFLMSDCSQRSLDHYPNITSTLCRKIVQKVDGQFRYIRTCGFLLEDREDCYRKAGTFNAQIEYCHCKDQPGCNSAPSVTSGSVTFLVVTVGAMFAVSNVN